MKIRAALLVLLAVGGCQTITPEERRAQDHQTCRNYGFKRNTSAFAECLQRIDLNRAADARANRAYFNDWEQDYYYRRYRNW